MRAHVTLALAMLGLHLAPALQAEPCNPADRAFVCGLSNPEDLVHLQGTRWVVASQVNFKFVPPYPASFGPVRAIGVDTHEVRLLYPTAESEVDWDRELYPDCATPPESLSSHGVNARSLGNNRHRLYVINHGGRHSVEILDVAVEGERLRTTWRGCVRTPEGIFPNGVVPLQEDGIAVSGFGVAIWTPQHGWKVLEDFAGSNGLEASRDGTVLFIAVPEKRVVVRVAVNEPTARTQLAFDFLPDNLRWGEDRRLYVSGPRWALDASPAQRLACFANLICDVGFAAAEIDPHAFTSKEVLRSEGLKGRFGAATTALQVNDELWIATSRGDRVAIFPVKHRSATGH